MLQGTFARGRVMVQEFEKDFLGIEVEWIALYNVDKVPREIVIEAVTHFPEFPEPIEEYSDKIIFMTKAQLEGVFLK